MANKPGLLARLFGRSKHPVVASLATAALNRPLLINPPMGEAVIGAYLEGAVTSADTELHVEYLSDALPVLQTGPDGVATVDEQQAPAPNSRIAVVNVSGALVNRPMPGPSGGGPLSYTALRATLDELVEDESVRAIVLRLDSPGGMASGCFDLVDHIYGLRGSKPLHALVDDYAFSAAYAIASACDEIWVSRTGSVGSVGVVAFHYDWSGTNEQMGLKVTPIFAGARKIDFNPNFPLSEEAQAQAQADIDEMYGLFAATVARNRGLDVATVTGWDAATFRGQLAVDAGAATRLGTWDDLMASLDAEGADQPQQPGDTEEGESEASAASAARAVSAVSENGIAVQGIPGVFATQEEADRAVATHDAAAAVAALQQAGLSGELTAAILPRATSPAVVDAAVAHAKSVIDLCAAAKKPELAARFVAANTELDAIREQLTAEKAAAEPEVVTTLPALSAAKPMRANPLDPQAIYSNRR